MIFTGGEGLILVVFGMIANEFNLPMHLYNIAENKLIEITEKYLSENVLQQEISFDLDRYIDLYGGKINYYLQKAMKYAASVNMTEEVNILWKISAKHKGNCYVNFCAKLTIWREAIDCSATHLTRVKIILSIRPNRVTYLCLNGGTYTDYHAV